MLTLLVAGCQALPATLTTAKDVQPGEVAFTFAGPGGAALVVPVRLNGRGPFQFVLDTGATLTCVDERIARDLDLPQQPGMRGLGAGIRGGGAVRLVRIESVSVGSAEARRVTGCALDLKSLRQIGIEVDGLLGLNFLRAFRVTLDFERNALKLDRSDGAEAGGAE